LIDKHAMMCEKCQARDAAVPITRVLKRDRKVFQLCWPCASSFDWDEEGRLTGTDLSNLGLRRLTELHVVADFVSLGVQRAVFEVRLA